MIIPDSAHDLAPSRLRLPKKRRWAARLRRRKPKRDALAPCEFFRQFFVERQARKGRCNNFKWAHGRPCRPACEGLRRRLKTRGTRAFSVSAYGVSQADCPEGTFTERKARCCKAERQADKARRGTVPRRRGTALPCLPGEAHRSLCMRSWGRVPPHA